MQCKKYIFNHTTLRVRDKSEWVIREGVIPEIISKELFDKCQERMNKHTKRERGIVQADYTGKDKFANKIVCGSCTQSYVVTGTKPYKYYMCRTKKNHGKERCSNNNLPVERLEECLDLIFSALFCV